jgi:HK97 family phage major capsid protein
MIALPDLNSLRSTDELAAHDKEIVDRLKEIEVESAGLPYSEEQRAEYAALRDRLDNTDPNVGVRARMTELKERKAYLAKIADQPQAREMSGTDLSSRSQVKSRLPENVFDLSEYHVRSTSEAGKAALIRDGAKKAVEQATFPHPRADYAKNAEHITKLLADDDAQGTFARLILTTGSPEYQRAWAKTMAGRPLSNAERAAIDVVGTTTAGGYAIPYVFDPSVVLTTDGSINPIRSMARVERIVGAGNTWRVPTSDGLTLSRGPAEDLAVTEASPVFGIEEVTVQPVKGEVRYSVEADEDWPRLQATLAEMIQEAKDDEEANSFINGVGTTVYPAGVVSTLPAGFWVGTDSDGFSMDDVDRLEARLGPKYRARAQYLANHAIYQAIDRFSVATTGAGGAYRPNQTVGLPSTLNGYPAREASTMEDDYTTSGNKILLFGDFRNFLIVDKVGLTVEIDPHVVDGDGKHLFKRALLIHYRNTSVILNPRAFRLLVVGSVAS